MFEKYPKFLTGSRRWFSCYPDFKPKDTDYVVLCDDIDESFLNVRSEMLGDLFIYRSDANIDTVIKMHPYAAAVWLIEEMSSIETLKEHRHLIYAMSRSRYEYLKIICDAFIENKAFVLTDMQRAKAYASYKSSRPERYSSE